jgi:ADP-ribose pyrophosphatase YjhB (NUDIX family)
MISTLKRTHKTVLKDFKMNKNYIVETNTVHPEKNAVFIVFYTEPYHHYQTAEHCRKWGTEGWYAKVSLMGVMMRWDFSCGFVGGSVDKGETLLAAAVRECKEEVGHYVNPNSLTPVCSHYMKDNSVEQITHLYAYKVTPEEIYEIQTKSTSVEATDARVENSAYAVVHMVNDSFDNLLSSKWAGTGLEELKILLNSNIIHKPIFEKNDK